MLNTYAMAQELNSIKAQINSREKVILTDADLVWIQIVILEEQVAVLLNQIADLSDLYEMLRNI